LKKDNCQCCRKERALRKKDSLLRLVELRRSFYYELVPDGRTINADMYSQQLDKMYTVLLEKYPALVNRKRVLLQQDKTRPHTAKKTLQKMEELEGIELLPHPAFSPDLESSDNYLFRSMAQFLRGKCVNL
jgi:histone-lysine N-methyltransferase SETMAR